MEFGHTEWSDYRLEKREAELEATLEVKHNETRLGEIALELACVRYERKVRKNEEKQRQEEIAWLEHDAAPDTVEFPVIEVEDEHPTDTSSD